MLTNYNGSAITYDAIGNPLTFDGATLTWERGRKLSSYTKGDGTAITYKYDANGIRTQKTVGGVTTDYFLQGSTIVAQKTGNNVIWYYFDGDGTRDAIEYNGTVYYYMYNPQGDVIGLFNDNLDVVVEYAYDSWGNLVSMTGSLASTLGQDNPFRYRGYYYDSETGMYYLNSRYYHPQIGRFINADGYVQTGQGLLDKNMFAYCGNNPVNRIDPSGQSWADVKNWFAEKWNSVKEKFESLKKKAEKFINFPYDTADEAATVSGKGLNILTQVTDNEYGQGIVYDEETNSYGLTNVISGEHSSVDFGDIISDNENLIAVVHSHPNCTGHIGNEFSNEIQNPSGKPYGDWLVASSNSINVYLAAPNGNLYVMYWDVGEWNQNPVCDGLPIDNSQIDCS